MNSTHYYSFKILGFSILIQIIIFSSIVIGSYLNDIIFIAIDSGLDYPLLYNVEYIRSMLLISSIILLNMILIYCWKSIPKPNDEDNLEEIISTN